MSLVNSHADLCARTPKVHRRRVELLRDLLREAVEFAGTASFAARLAAAEAECERLRAALDRERGK